MTTGILTIIFCILTFVMIAMPVLGAIPLSENASTILDGLESFFERLGLSLNQDGYGLIRFEEGQSTYLIVANVFIILTLVFAGLTLIFSLISVIQRANGGKKRIGAKPVAVMFFLCALVASIMLVLYGNEIQPINDTMELEYVYTIGWGMLVAFASSLLALIFAPRRKK